MNGLTAVRVAATAADGGLRVETTFNLASETFGFGAYIAMVAIVGALLALVGVILLGSLLGSF